MSHHRHFFRAFLRNAVHVGAIAPSSNRLADLMVNWLDWDSINAVVEFGSGTGVFTEAAIRRLRPEARLLAIERDPELAAITQKRCPEAIVREACISEVARLCREAGIEQVDAILCGVPWAVFSSDLQDQFLDAMFEVLPPGGEFATFLYWQGLLLPAGLRFRKKLKNHFRSVEMSETAWRNLPPAFVYRCKR